jgi:FKBP-type peptidyl-prolyl cis-trans isomerase 2
MRIRYFVSVMFAICALSGPLWGAAAEKAKDDRVVKDGMLVSIDFTVKSPDGKVIETSKGTKPVAYIHGKKMLPPGLEKELTGMKVGAEKQVTVPNAYGKVDPKAVVELPKEKVPPNALKVGAVLLGRGPDGVSMPMTVREVKEKSVVFDLNHPMAGKTLVFDVKVVDIKPAPPIPTQPATPAAPAKPNPPVQPATPAAPTKPNPPSQPAKPADPAIKK